MKLIAVSQRVDAVPKRGERRDALDQRLVQWLTQAGYLSVPVPNSLANFEAWLGAIKPSAIILSGGNDINDAPERDRCETALLEYAASLGLPLLGICRGMQMMGVASGALLKPVAGHVCTRHRLQGEIVQDVNSYHSFNLADCPRDYKILARSEDGEIEAIRHTRLPWQGWMWHPEREALFSEDDVARLQVLFNK